MPSALLRQCREPGCGELVQRGRCPICSRTREQQRGTRQQRGYGAAWQRTRGRVLREAPWCSKCAEGDIVTPATEVDHITPKVDGGTDDRSNLAGLCRSCHSRKTATEDHGFGRR